MSAVVVATLDISESDRPGPLYCSVSVPAGFPSPAQDYFTGRIDLNKHLIIL
jgi:DNA polymerase V